MSISKAAPILEGTIQTALPRALLEVVIGLQLTDMPGKVLHAFFQQGEFIHRLIHLMPILTQQFITTLLTGLIVATHANDGSDLSQGEVEFLQFCYSVDVDNIRISIEALPSICAALGLE